MENVLQPIKKYKEFKKSAYELIVPCAS